MRRVILVAILATLSLCAGVTVNAQVRTITGIIADKASNSSIPGVSVLVKGTTTGTISDTEGKFSIQTDVVDPVLIFSFVGYLSQEISVGTSGTVDVSMAEDTKTLSEVVVTALGITRAEESLGYSVQSVSSAGMEQARETNFVNSLAGKVAGVQITGSAGNIGGSSRITMRGINSISGNNQPLFIVDGTPIDNSNYNAAATTQAQGGRDYGNVIQDINPDDIESISVLKGANAAALYGNRASNGVILITTKSGKGKKGIGVSWNSTYTFEKAYILPDYQNEYGGGYVQEFATLDNGQAVAEMAADESWGPKLEGQMVRQWYSFYPELTEYYGKATPWVAHPDNIKDFYETGTTKSNNISVEGGNDMATFRLSYTNVDQQGIVPNSSLKRNTFSINGEAKLTPKLTAGAKVNYVNSSVIGRPPTGGWNGDQALGLSFNTWFERQLDLTMMKNYRSPTGRILNWNLSSPDNLDPYYWNNDYFVLNECYSEDSRNRIFGNVYLSYDVTPHLKVTGYARTDFYDYLQEDRLAEGFIYQTMYEKSLSRFQENNYELLAQYNRELSPSFSLSVNVGTNTRRTKTDLTYGKTQGGLSSPNYFNLRASSDPVIVDDSKSELVVNSIYGSANLGFKSLIYAEVTNRADWSSSLPLSDNVYYFPSVSGSFVFSELLKTSVLPFGKIRVGWAKTGNGTDPYRLRNVYEAERSYGSQPVFTLPNSLNNPLLKPEQTNSIEAGIEVKFINNRIGFDVTYYSKKSTNQIIPLTVSGTSGYSEAIVNAGKLTNKGIEIALLATPVQSPSGFTWDLGLNFARNRNKVVELAAGLDNYLLGSTVVSVNALVGRPYGTIYGNGYALNDNGERLVDSDGYYVVQQNKDLGSILPDFTGGFTNTLTYKGFSLFALIDFQKGGKLFSRTSETGIYSGLMIETVGNNDKGIAKRDPVSDGGGLRATGVTESGEENAVYLDAPVYFKYLADNISEEFVFDATFVKFRELRFGYSFPKKWFSKMPIQAISLSFVGRNLAVIYKAVPHIDPEAALGSSNFQGIEDSQVPSARSMGFNLNVKF